MRSLSVLLLVLLPALFTGDPAHAARNRLTAFLEVTFTPAAERHRFGVGLGVEAAAAFTQRTFSGTAPPVDANAGLGVRLRFHGDGGLDFAMEPIVGLIAGAPELVCGSEFPLTASLDVRPGLILRSRGGPGLSLGGAVTGVYKFWPLRAHASAVFLSREDPRKAPRVAGVAQDFAIGVGSGLSLQAIGCLE